LDFEILNDYVLILTSKGLYVSNDMSNSSSVDGVRMLQLTFTSSFDYKELGCSSVPVGLYVALNKILIPLFRCRLLFV